jgi:hypothetical protein
MQPNMQKINLLLKFPLLLCFCIPVLLFGQEFTLRGKVIDSLTLEPLAFVNILVNNGQYGGMSDIDGRFSFSGKLPFSTIRMSHVGYCPLEATVTGSYMNIKMSPVQVELPEVMIVAGENPALRIIRNAVDNRKINNPTRIPHYTFTSYDKMIFTVNTDSLSASLETDDPKDIKLREVIERQHLFMMESVSEHSFTAPDKSFDKIIATRVSGFKDPLFLFLISQLQSTSFYDETITIVNTRYINPISPNSWKHYYFALRDTLFLEGEPDTTFVISYKPRAGRNFDGLQGILYISSNGWSIRNVTAMPARQDEKMGVKIQQLYEFVDGKQWFPVQLNTEITFNTIDLNGARPVGIGKSYRRNIDLEGKPEKSAPLNISAELMPYASIREEEFWKNYRVDTLSERELNTYHIIDSLGRANRFDEKMKGLGALLTGRLPIGYLELDINRLFRYSKYEGFYAGLGLSTSDKVSRFFKIGGYWGYGFGDQRAKYGGDLQLKLHPYGNLMLDLSYAYDLSESAGTVFFDDVPGFLSAIHFRDFYVNFMDRGEKTSANLTFRMLQYVKAGIGISIETKESCFDYGFREQFDGLAVLTDKHRFGKLTAGIKFAWGERFIRDRFSQVSTGTKYPELWLQYTRGQEGLFDGQFSFNRIDLKVNATANFRFAGKTTLWLTGDLVDGDVPMSELINGRGGAGSGFSLFAPFSFTTMKPGEFINDRLAALFITHSFEKLLFRTEKFTPQPSLVFNAGFGSLRNPEMHHFPELKTMEKGYFEGGLLIDNLLSSPISSIGAGVFYRLGDYAYHRAGKNFFFRLSINYAL